MNRITTAALVAAALAAVALRADDVTLNDGTVLQGKVTIQTPQRVVLQMIDGRRLLDRADVASIEKKPFIFPAAKAAAPAAAPAPVVTEGVAFWPPVVGQPYPDLALRESDGSLFQLSSLKGKVILVEPVGMSCAACQSFSGAALYGSYLGIPPQSGLDSFEHYLFRYGNGLTLDNPNVVLVQLLLYDLNMRAPTVADAKAWADHFRLSGRPHVHVLVGTPKMVGPASFALIPGVFLIDKDFILRSENVGDQGAGSDLYADLLPMAGKLAGKAP